MRSSLLALGLLLAPLPALAQIEVEALGEARAFAPGVESASGLEPSAWSGTSAARATRLLETIDIAPTHPVAREMLRRVVLGGLAVPDGADEPFKLARIRAAQILATPKEYARFAARNPAANDPRLRADAKLAAGDLAGACEIGDTITQDRTETYWVRLRVACLEDAGQTAAAELAADLLRERGESVALTVGTPPEGFWAEVAARDGEALRAFLSDLAIKDMDLSQGIVFDTDVASLDTSDKGSAQLYQLALQGDVRAAALFVRRAEAAGLDADAVLARMDAVLDPGAMAREDLALFARHGVVTRDIGLLSALFGALEADDPNKQRLALATDALGGGFFARPLGESLEEGLSKGIPLAVHDALVALALGAELSETAEAALFDVGAGERPKAWLAIDAAQSRGARAELLLRLAPVVADAKTPAQRYQAIRALRTAGFNDLAAQAAALAFLEPS